MLSGWKANFAKMMYGFVVVSQAWLLIQMIEIYRTKDTKGISLLAFSFLACGHLIWIIYGWFVMQPRNYIMVLGSSIALLLTIGILIGLLVYG